jgi:hypothetical protein
MPGAKLYFYEAGTTTPLDVYSDAALSTAISQPVVSDSAGRFEDIFMAADDYKVVLKSSADVTVWTVDDYTPGANGSTNLLNGIGTKAAARTAIGAASASDVSSNTTSLASIESQLTAIGGTLGDMAAEDDVAVANLATGFGVVCLQRASYTNSASTAISTMPEDGTVPQNTEGTEVFNEDFTPESATSTLIIKGIINLDASSSSNLMVAIFAGGSTGAQRTFGTGESRDTQIAFYYEYEPGTTSAVNIMIRAGKGGGTVLLNSASLYGSSSVSNLVIEEWSTI